jgi:osmotically-inducible protein OsmY
MKLKTQPTTNNVSDAAKQARTTLSDAQKQARETIKEARRQARRQVFQARVAAARARAGTRTRASGASRKAVGAAGAAGLAAGYFLDPDSGRRRREQIRDRAGALIRRGRIEAGKAKGKVTPEKTAANDQALADRVKTEIFQPADAPKGSVNVNVENGVVYLRGEVKRPDEMQKLVEQASSVAGVAAVEDLLHTT